MCGKMNMEQTRQERARVQAVYPAGSQLSLSVQPSDSGRSVLVYVGNERGSLMWGYAVIRSGAYELRIRLPKEPVNMRNFVALKINQAIWGKNVENYYSFRA
jgi:hypothetical protein